MLGIRDVMNYCSDHFSLLARILQRQTWCHGNYLRGRRALPLSLPAPEDFILSDNKFQGLNSLETPSPPPHPH